MPSSGAGTGKMSFPGGLSTTLVDASTGQCRYLVSKDGAFVGSAKYFMGIGNTLQYGFLDRRAAAVTLAATLKALAVRKQMDAEGPVYPTRTKDDLGEPYYLVPQWPQVDYNKEAVYVWYPIDDVILPVQNFDADAWGNPWISMPPNVMDQTLNANQIILGEHRNDIAKMPGLHLVNALKGALLRKKELGGPHDQPDHYVVWGHGEAYVNPPKPTPPLTHVAPLPKSDKGSFESLFKPDPKWQFLHMDYSELEAKVIASQVAMDLEKMATMSPPKYGTGPAVTVGTFLGKSSGKTMLGMKAMHDALHKAKIEPPALKISLEGFSKSSIEAMFEGAFSTHPGPPGTDPAKAKLSAIGATVKDLLKPTTPATTMPANKLHNDKSYSSHTKQNTGGAASGPVVGSWPKDPDDDVVLVPASAEKVSLKQAMSIKHNPSKLEFIANKDALKNVLSLSVFLTFPPTQDNPHGAALRAQLPEWHSVAEGEEIHAEGAEPTFTLRPQDAQRLMTELWIMGVRPDESCLSSKNKDKAAHNAQAEIETLKEHRKDLRDQIAFLQDLLSKHHKIGPYKEDAHTF